VLFDGFRIKSKVEQGDYAALKRYYDLNAGVEQKALKQRKPIWMFNVIVNWLVGRNQFNNHQRVYNQISKRPSRV
jgi:adhesin transport system outer membrane protein